MPMFAELELEQSDESLEGQDPSAQVPAQKIESSSRQKSEKIMGDGLPQNISFS